MDEILLRKLFAAAASQPSRRPRFGETAPVSESFADAKVSRALDQPPKPPFRVEWRSQNLKLKVVVDDRTGDRGGEVWAEATSSDPACRGQEVSVALVGAEDRMRRVTIVLDEDGVGTAQLGRLDELRDELGLDVSLVCFLLATDLPHQ